MSGFGWSNMFVAPEEDPRTDGGFVGERATLLGFLADQRLTLELKCAGLSTEQLASRSVEPSKMSLLGLVRHMADVERDWFRIRLAGNRVERLYRTPENRDADFDGALPDDEVVAAAFTAWKTEIAYAEDFTDSVDDLGWRGRRGQRVLARSWCT